MGFLRAAVVKDLRRVLRDPWAIASWLGIPVLIGALFSLAFGGEEGPRPRVDMFVADLDDSVLSGLLVGALESEQLDLVEAKRVDADEGRRLIENGKASALLVIPDGFGDALVRETPVTLELVTHPGRRVGPAIVEELLSTMADAVFYAHRLVGEELRLIADGDPTGLISTEALVASVSVRLQRVVERLSDHLSPPLVRVEPRPSVTDAGMSGTDIGRLFFPGILFMALLFTAQGLSADVWRERDLRTLRRVVASPQSAGRVVAGKLVSASVVLVAVSTSALLVGRVLYDVPTAALPLAIVWSTLSGVMLLAILLLVHVFAPSARAGGLITMLVVFPLMMLGGSFFPSEMMSGWMGSIGRLTPNGWALAHLKEIAWGQPNPASLLPAFGLVTLLIAALAFVVATRVRVRFGLE